MRQCSKGYLECEWFSADHFADNNLIKSVCCTFDITIIAFTVTAQLKKLHVQQFTSRPIERPDCNESMFQ